MPYRLDVVNDEPFCIAELTPSKKIECSIKKINGRTFIDIRRWVRFHGDTELKPTKYGICIDISVLKNTILPALNRYCDQDFRLVDEIPSTEDPNAGHEHDTETERHGSGKADE